MAASPPALQPENYQRLFDGLYATIFVRTFVMAAIATAGCLLFGFPLALFISRARSRSPKPVSSAGDAAVLEQLPCANVCVDVSAAGHGPDQHGTDGDGRNPDTAAASVQRRCCVRGAAVWVSAVCCAAAVCDSGAARSCAQRSRGGSRSFAASDTPASDYSALRSWFPRGGSAGFYPVSWSLPDAGFAWAAGKPRWPEI